ncbi:MAG: elongation factor 1-beta [Thermoplasmata archaeon]|nr:elongation factor 1-beta [Thermoplasmata archaeon]
MGEVMVLFRLMPHGVETDMDAVASGVKGAVPTGVRIRGMQIKDIAFGLKALLVAAAMPDTGGILDTVEEAFAKVAGVESVEVMEESLV